MTPESFRAIGAALYGPAWQRELARTLELNERAVRHWAGGSRDIPPDMAKTLARLLRAKATALAAMAKGL